MKFGQILVCCMTNISNMLWLNPGDWKLVPGLFMILLKWQYSKICPFLIVDVFVPYSLFQKNEALESWHDWLLSNWSSLLNWKGPGTKPQSSNCSKSFRKILLLLTSISWPGLVGYWVVVQKIYLKMYPVSCTNTHHDVIYLLNRGMAKNTKMWISWEQNITFLWNKIILNLCLR